MNTYWTETAQLYLILHDFFFRKISASQIWSSGSFEERLFPEALLSLFLSGGMIFISHLLRRLYFFISRSALHCIICLDHFNLILLRHIIGDIEWRLIFRWFYVSICCTVRKISLISLQIESLIHIFTVSDYMRNKSLIYQKRHST